MSNFQFFCMFSPIAIYTKHCALLLSLSTFPNSLPTPVTFFAFLHVSPIAIFNRFQPTGTVHVSAHILNLSSKYSSNILAWSCPGFMPNKMSHYWWSKTMEMAEGVATLFQGVRSVVRDSRNWLCTHFAVCFQLRPPREWQECIRRWVSPPQRQHKGNVIYPSKIALCGVTEVQMTRVIV